ncbi:MAG: Gfo/Idh/MocA family protein [Verrucomicrobiota bacterium]
MNPIISRGTPLTRRHFLSSTSATVGAAALGGLAIDRLAHAQASDTLRIALIGCGGRGSGAASQALGVEGVRLVAMADAFEGRLKGSLNNLKSQHSAQVDVPESRRFIGLDSYKEAIAQCDVAILATPPGFRPQHFEEAIRQGKHVFMEKPVAVDGPGVRKVLAAAAEAKKKNLKVGVGLQRRHQKGYLESIKRLQDGAIGEVAALRVYWNGNTPWLNKRADLEKRLDRKITEMEYQLLNWYYFVWLCGDHIVEQHIHNLDVGNWVMGKFPVRAWGMGGCEVRKGKDYGEIFDHHAVEFEYEGGVRMFSQCRHQLGCWNSVTEHVIGSAGTAELNAYSLRPKGGSLWRFRERETDAYQQEHYDLFEAIRKNREYNEAEYGAMSSATAILGRVATYTGREVTMEQLLNSKVDTFPKSLAWDAEPPTVPGADGLYALAIPGNEASVRRVV